MDNLRILHVIPSVSSVRGGPSQAILEMVSSLCQLGISAEIATTNDHGLHLLNVPLNHLLTYQGVPTRFFARFSPNVIAVREFAFSGSFTHWLWLNIHNYDLVHVHAIFSYVSTAAMAIARIKKIPYIVRPLGQLCQWSLQQSAFRKKTYLHLIEKSNIDRSSFIHFTSYQEEAEASDLNLTAQSLVIPHGLSVKPLVACPRQRIREDLHCPENDPIIVFLSRLHPKKGLEFLIPALGKLKDYSFTLVIAGSGDHQYESTIRTLVSTHGLTERTRFMGFVTGEQKDLLLQGSDLFVLTSYSENFGIVVLEAMAAGLPVLLTPGVALAADVQKHCAGTVTHLDIDSISQAIAQYLDHPDTAKSTGDRARQFVLNHYTWDRVAAQLIEVYTAILEQKSANGLLS